MNTLPPPRPSPHREPGSLRAHRPRWSRVVLVILIAGLSAALLYLAGQRDGLPDPTGQSARDLSPASLESDVARTQTTASRSNAVPVPSTSPVSTLAAGETEVFTRFDVWVARFQERPAQERLEASSEGLELAWRRHGIMERLIREDPRQALARAVSWDAWIALPDALRPWVEEPFSTRMEVEVVAACGPEGEMRQEPNRWLRGFSGEPVAAHVHGRRAAFGSKRDQAVQGIRLGGHAAVRESVLQILTPAEVAAVRDRFPAWDPSPGRASGRGEPRVEPVHALGGGRLYAFADEAEVAVLEERLAQLEALPGPESVSGRWAEPEFCGTDGAPDLARLTKAALHGASQWTRTPKKVFIIRVDFPDVPGNPVSREVVRERLNGPISQWFRTQSRGVTWIEAEASSQVFRLARRGDDYFRADHYVSILEDAREAARGAYDLAGYQIVGVAFPEIGFTWAGRASLGSDDLWLEGSWFDSVASHELGHNYGLHHASGWRTSDGTVTGDGRFEEYGNPFDRMGSGTFPEGYFQPASLLRLAWVPAGETPEVVASGRYRLPAHDRFRAGPVGFQLAVDEERHWMSFRALGRQQRAEGEGLELNQVIPGETRTRMLDFTPGTEGFRDALLPVGQAYLDPRSRFCITPLATGGTEPDEWIEFAVEFDGIGFNVPPSGTVEPVAPPRVRQPSTFRIAAEDPNGDELHRFWTVDDGPWRPGGETVSHRFAVGGSHRLRARIIDAKGGSHETETTVSLADPLLDWSPTWTNRCQAFGVGSDRVIASARGKYWSSFDLEEWVPVGSLGANQSLQALATDGARWVGVGQGYDFARGTSLSLIVASENGSDWSEAVYPPGTNNLVGVTFGAGMWVAVGWRSTVLRSIDGRRWQSVPLPGKERFLESVAFGHGQFVLVGGDLIARSQDGLVWTTNAPPASFFPENVAFLEGESERPSGFYVGGWSPLHGGIARSSDATTWAFCEIPEAVRDARVNWICRTPDGALLAGLDSPSGYLGSVDGIHWEWVPSATPPARSPAAFRGRLVGPGSQGDVMRSGSTSPGNQPPRISLPSVLTASARTSFQTQARVSDPDGEPTTAYWELGDGRWVEGSPTRTDWWPIGGRVERRLMVIDASGASVRVTSTIDVSGPMTVWTPATSSPTNAVLDLVTGPGNRALAVTSRALYTSTDGLQWARIAMPGANLRFEACAVAGDTWVLVGWDFDFTVRRWVGVVWYSSDGVAWTRTFEGQLGELQAVAEGGGVWVALGSNGAALRSENGRQWTPVTLPPGFGDADQVVRCGNAFVASGTRGLWISSDGWSWFSRPGPVQGKPRGILVTGGWLAAHWSTGTWMTADFGSSWRAVSFPRLTSGVPSIPFAQGLHLAFGATGAAANGVYYSTDTRRWRWMELAGMPQASLVVPWGDTGRFLLATPAGRLYLSDVLPPEPGDWAGWQAFHLTGSAAADETADADGDGRANFVEYAFGSNPNAAEFFRPPRLALEGGFAVVTVEKPPGRESVRYEASVPAALNPGLTAAERVLTVLEDGPGRLRVRLPGPAASRRAAFVTITPRR